MDLRKLLKEMRKGAREISKSYVAAFLDGEGSIHIGISKGTLSMRIGFMQTDSKILKEIQEKYGGRLYSKKSRKENQRSYYELYICKMDESKKFLLDIYPYVIQKRKQIKVAFIFLWLLKKHSRGKGYPISKDLKKLLLLCKRLMNTLNVRGSEAESKKLEENIEKMIRELMLQIGDLKEKDSKQLKLF